MRYAYFLTFPLVWFAFSYGEETTAVVQEKPAFVIEKDVPIEALFSHYHMVVDLGTLPLGVKGVAMLNLINRHQVTFPVNDLELGCSCTSARIDVPEIEPNSSALLTVTLNTRSGSKSQAVTNSVTLVSKSDKTKNITLALKYNLSGLMCFAGTAYVQEVDASLDHQTVMVPFLITDPVVGKDVSFEVVPNSPGVVASLVEENGKRYAKIEFDPVFVTDDSLHLSIVARDDSRELIDTLPLLLCKRKHLEITPRTLRLRSEDDQLLAECLLRYRPPLVDAKNDVVERDPTEIAISVEASLGDVKLKVRTKKLGRGIYRVYVTGARAVFQKHIGQEKREVLRWHVVTPEKVYSVESLYSVDSFVSVSPNEKKEEL